MPAVRDAAGLRRKLAAWFERHQRAMPWRATRDPYRVWVSEIMLQQTQVATVTPYYERFVARFPDVRSLAAAAPDQVLAAWSGLGYYRRARFLHEAAGLVVREHAGSIPSDPRAFGELPGVGRYTLGAVLSISFGASLPVLDGNVARVFSRLSGRPLAIKRPADAKALWAMAEALMPGWAGSAGGGSDPGQWNQALMELGALVCTPAVPRCGDCPVKRHCVAFETGQQDELPPVVDRRATVKLRRAVVRIFHCGRLLVVQRQGVLLNGLWEPPGVELARGDDAAKRLRAALAVLEVKARLSDSGERVRHTITHRDIDVQVFDGTLVGVAPRTSTRLRWAEPGSRALALSALARRVIAGVAHKRA